MRMRIKNADQNQLQNVTQNRTKVFIRNLALNLGVFILCAIFFNFAIQFITFPNKIVLMANTENSLDFKLPFSAVISMENAVVNDQADSVEALHVNNQPVRDNIKISLGDKLDIKPMNTGGGSMTLNLFGLPIKKVALSVLPDVELVPCGSSIGVRVSTNGIMVLGTGTVDGADGQAHNPCEGELKSGDMIMQANGKTMLTNKDLIDAVRGSGGSVNLSLMRGGQMLQKNLTAVKNQRDDAYSIGAWVRDSTQGIGTLTYFEPQNGRFGALGHGITDVDTKQIMDIREGIIMSSAISSVKKGKKGAPGNLVGEINNGSVLGTIQKNTPRGIFGVLNYGVKSKLPGEEMQIALQDKVHTGPAIVKANVDGTAVQAFDAYIESVNHYSNDDTRGMIIRITDPLLLRRTNGIVQGMSGSPIIQDGKLIGALTHVFLQEPMKGYGIFIENMLNN